MPRDIETQLHEADLSDSEDHEPLLTRQKSSSKSSKSTRHPRTSQDVIELDDIPPIIKSAGGNIFWADERCNRRVGLTASEARLFLCLLQEEAENYNFEDYKALFDDFGREQDRLQELVDSVRWWDFNHYRQRSIWQARIQWLDRMREPRLWLMYLMARRRRILKQAADRILERLREKRLEKEACHDPAHKPSIQPPTQQPITNGAAQPPDSQPDSPIILPDGPSGVSEESQVSARHLSISHPRASIHEILRSSFSSGRRSHSSQGHRPVFEKPYHATKADIRRQVEKLMPRQVPYLVIGFFPHSSSDPFERTLQFEEPAHLFKTLRRGEKEVRSWRRVLSLKALKGFGLYKCDISRGAHIPLVLTASQKAVLAQFFLAYKASNRHADEAVATAWQGWVHKNLNDCKNNPLEGRYSLQLIYDWSAYRLTFIVMVPLLLSFALGLWYMIEFDDPITAWTIGLYIVTAAAALVALMTIIGGLKSEV